MDKLKLAISNIAWDKINDQRMYEYLKNEDITGLEIAPTRLFEKEPYEQLNQRKEYAKMLKSKYNLDIVSMQSIWFGKTQNIFESDVNAKELIQYTIKAIDFAEAVGCTNLVFGCPKNRNIRNYNEDYIKAIKFFKEIGEYANKKKTVIAIEPNPTIYNTNFLNYTEQAIQFVKEINLGGIKVNYDLGTVICNDEKLEILKNNIDLINHIHISEPNLEIIKQRKVHEELAKILKESNYSKYVSIEMKKNEKIEDLEKTIEYVKNIFTY